MTVKTFSKSKDGSKKLTTHFIVKEFACQDGTDKILIDSNICPTLEKIFSKWAVNYIQINSGYRTPEHDKSVGGSGSGQHTKGTASDFQVMLSDGKWLDSKYICCFLQDLGVQGIGYISERAVHLDFRTSGKWWGDETNGKTVSDWYSYFGLSDMAHTNPYDEPSTNQYEGCSGDDVKWCQYELNNGGFNCGSVDGVFGGITDTATRNFQKAKKLTVDGVIGKNTRNALKNDGK